jgi:nucleoside-diphosphate-sugar epimerase
MTRIVAITGGRGFIGSHLVRSHLESGDRLRVLTRSQDTLPGVERFTGDLAAGDIPDAFFRGADVLYHCAGEIRDETLMERVHVAGTRALVRAAAGQVGRWVQLSSVGVYGRRKDGVVTEADSPAPVGVYERTKAESDVIVETSGIPYAILRPSIIFGIGMPNRSLQQLVSMIERGLFFFIGRPGALANYIPVENVVDALRLCAFHDAAAQQIFNLSDLMTMEQFVGTIARAAGRKPPSLRLPVAPMRIAARLPGLPLTQSRIDALTSRVAYPSAKIEASLGYRHRLGLAEALTAFVEARPR